jgi:preprotein translocase subunit SecD
MIEVEDTARLIKERLRRAGIAQFDVTPSPPNEIEVSLPAAVDQTDARLLVGSTGDVQLVPIPADSFVEAGSQLPPDLTPLFGREGFAEVRESEDDSGRRALDIVLNPDASLLLAAHSRAHFGEQMALAADNTVLIAPTINGPLEDGRIQISGGFESEFHHRTLVVLLDLPPLPRPMEEISFEEVDPPAGCS